MWISDGDPRCPALDVAADGSALVTVWSTPDDGGSNAIHVAGRTFDAGPGGLQNEFYIVNLVL